jgi:hypothetical protein
VTKKSKFGTDNTQETKRKSLEALDRAPAGTTRLRQLMVAK